MPSRLNDGNQAWWRREKRPAEGAFCCLKGGATRYLESAERRIDLYRRK